jgi:peptidyl-prolyl isomerase E (cyclophilin E)
MEGAASSSSKTRNTVYVAGLADEVNEQQLLDAFVTFGMSQVSTSTVLSLIHLGDIIEIKLPIDPQNKGKHRGFAFLTFTNPGDAADAIDNYDLNELPGYVGRGKFLKCSVANPNKFAAASGDKKFDRPGTSVSSLHRFEADHSVWESEEWLQENEKKDEGEVTAVEA